VANRWAAGHSGDLTELAERKLIRTYISDGVWEFTPTRDARLWATLYERDLPPADRNESFDLSWDAVRAVLHALVDVWERRGASSGVSIPIPIAAVAQELDQCAGDFAVVRVFELLAVDGWLEAVYTTGMARPTGFHPSTKALAATRGWPGGGPQAGAE
jgi:hypothetical protein